jgi:hypothetical protein
MKALTTTLGIFLVGFLLLPGPVVQAQSILNPNDPVITYNGTEPAQPPFGQIGQWIRTKRIQAYTDDYKAYIYKGVAFRLKFPKTYVPGVTDNNKYPMIIYFHGLGEAAYITDNEFHLYWGWNYFAGIVNTGQYDGYILYMQTQGFWGIGHHTYLTEIINYMIVNNKLDQFRVTSAGLSSGAYSATEMGINFPTYVNAILPTSGCSIGYRESNVTEALKFTPIWTFQGGRDGSPAPSTATQVRDAFLAAGANYKLTIYPDLGHNTWTTAWSEPDYLPFINRAHQANVWALYGKTSFCDGESINVTLGLTRGFAQYEWRKDNVLIPGATSNTIQVTQTGSYSARIRRGSEWSEWSPAPVNFLRSGPTSAPAIQVAGVMSKVLPALDGKTSVTLQVPAGYNSYEWYRMGSTTLLSTTNTINASIPDDYRVRAIANTSCPPPFSPLFRVVNANGPNKPPAASNLRVKTLSSSSLRLNWTNAPSPQFNESGFEIYQATSLNGPFTFIAITAADVQTYTVNNLQTRNTIYYYKLRAVNETGAAAASNVASSFLSIQGTASSQNLAQISESPGAALVENMPEVTVNVYPNPIVSDVSLRLSMNKAADKIGILVTDVTGKTIFTKELTQVPGGTTLHPLGINSKSLLPGVYFVKITGLPDGKSKTIRLVK